MATKKAELNEKLHSNTSSETTSVENVPVAKAPVKKGKVSAEKTSKPATTKTTAKKSTAKQSLYIEYQGKKIEEQEIISKIKKAWTSTKGNKISDIKSFEIYIKPEENAVYYVINGKENPPVYL